MCLYLKDESVKVQIAKRDIVVYKRLRCSTIRTIEQVKDGDSFSGVIKGISCSGKIHKDKNGSIYLCTDRRELNGSWTSEKHGYTYSWFLDGSVKSIIVDGVELVKFIVTKRFDFKTPYRDTDITIGETYTSKLVKCRSSIEDGLHSFARLEGAKNDGMGNSMSNCFIKCIIPNGSQYYKGEFGSSVSYASDKLTYVKLLK
jgi:hypothetical protein